MRSLIISIVSLSLFIVSWQLFASYSDSELEVLTGSFDDTVMNAVTDERWSEAEDSFTSCYDRWHSYKKYALYFLDTKEVNEADSGFARALMYIKAKDVSNSSGELLALREQLKLLRDNEELSLANIL